MLYFMIQSLLIFIQGPPNGQWSAHILSHCLAKLLLLREVWVTAVHRVDCFRLPGFWPASSGHSYNWHTVGPLYIT